MTNTEFKALKAKVQENKKKGVDLDKIVALFAPLSEAILSVLPEEVREVLEKYKH